MKGSTSVFDYQWGNIFKLRKGSNNIYQKKKTPFSIINGQHRQTNLFLILNSTFAGEFCMFSCFNIF